MKNLEVVLEELREGEKSICFFVHKGVCYWVLDYKYNFSLDAEPDYRGYREKGRITSEQYNAACEMFRGGVLRLTADNFFKYIEYVGEGVLALNDVERLFTYGWGEFSGLLMRVEKYYLSGGDLPEQDIVLVGSLTSRLPMFYINFDRKIYMHMDVGRFHEDLAYSDWYSKCSDFAFLIPDTQKYWVQDGDHWKIRFLQS